MPTYQHTINKTKNWDSSLKSKANQTRLMRKILITMFTLAQLTLLSKSW